MPNPLKIVLFGENRTGKTQICNRLIASSGSKYWDFNPNYKPTIGTYFVCKSYEKTRLNIWDTPGDLRFPTTVFSRGANVGFYCISLTEAINPQKIHENLECFRQQQGDKNLPIFLIGTKLDVEEPERKISDDQFNQLMQDKNYNFQGGLKISSKTDEGIAELLNLIPKDLLENKELEQLSKEQVEQLSSANSRDGFFNHAEKRSENTNSTICGMPSWLFWACLVCVGPGWIVGLIIAASISIYNCCTSVDVVENEDVVTCHS